MPLKELREGEEGNNDQLLFFFLKRLVACTRSFVDACVGRLSVN